jgi:hypothetical protein
MAMTEIAFTPVTDRVNAVNTLPPEAVLLSALEKLEEIPLEPVAEGAVQSETEAKVLELLRDEVEAARSRMPPGQLLVVENQPGIDWPKTRETRTEILEPMGNRFHFRWHVAPPLRLGRYRVRG